MFPSKLLAFALILAAPLSLHTQLPAAITTDPPPDKINPASFQAFQLPSHGSQLNALVYVAAGVGPHPTVVLLHGFPGNERNLDLAQGIRRAGWNVLFFDYRGSWGSPGDFSFTHCIEDTQAAIAYVRDPANASRLHSDPSTIVLFGHSMGGFLARYVGSHDPLIRGVVLVSAADMGIDRIEAIPTGHRDLAIAPIAKSFAAEGMAPLAGCSPESLAKEAVANADAWNVPHLAAALASRPLLLVTSDDGLAASNDAFVAALQKSNAPKLTTLHLATDHSYSGQRIALETAILQWLATLTRR